MAFNGMSKSFVSKKSLFFPLSEELGARYYDEAQVEVEVKFKLKSRRTCNVATAIWYLLIYFSGQ